MQSRVARLAMTGPFAKAACRFRRLALLLLCALRKYLQDSRCETGLFNFSNEWRADSEPQLAL